MCVASDGLTGCITQPDFPIHPRGNKRLCKVIDADDNQRNVQK